MKAAYYEILICYDQKDIDVIRFKGYDFAGDANDIVTQAIALGYLGEENRKQVRWAHSISKNEYME